MSEGLVDCFGRAVEQDAAGMWSVQGFKIGPCSPAQALHTLSGMAPPSYSAPTLPTAVPAEVSLVQLRLAMMAAKGRTKRTMLEDVDGMMNAAGPEAIELWEYAATVSRIGRLSTLLVQICHLTSPEIDNLFKAGFSICA